MKMQKHILVAVLAVGAGTARADFTINSDGTAVGSPGSSGKSDYLLVLTGTSPTTIAAGSYVLNDYSSQLSSFTFDAAASAVNLNDAQTLAAGSYEEVVDWTLKVSAIPGTSEYINFNIPVAFQDGVPVGANNTDTINVEAAPEPGQVMATGLLLGFGGMVFVTRRLLTKRTA